MRFVNAYTGPEYEIYLKYAYILKYVSVSLVYGYALPILFPITLVALINQYITDRLSLAYFYKKPPSYD
jgi:hypothetical protein